MNFKSLVSSDRENTYNKQIANTLLNRGHISKDQSQCGRSSTGKTIGNPDIVIDNIKGKTMAIIEGLILKSIIKKNITNHINKLLDYDSHILEYNFLIVYAETPKEKFNNFSERYIDNLPSLAFQYPLIGISIIPPYNLKLDLGIKIVTTKFRISKQIECVIYHLLVNLNLI